MRVKRTNEKMWYGILSEKTHLGTSCANKAETADLEADTVASQPYNDTSSSLSVNKAINVLDQAQCSPVFPQFCPSKNQTGKL